MEDLSISIVTRKVHHGGRVLVVVEAFKHELGEVCQESEVEWFF